MVVITIYIEGGVLPNANINALTINNSQRLRESFYKLFTQKIDESKFKLNVEIGSSNQQSINFFRNSIKSDRKTYLFIDLDAPKSAKKSFLISNHLNSTETQEHVFFMVQEMEAWILSQPDKIESCYSHLIRRKPSAAILMDNNIVDKNPEDITKPSRVLGIILGRYFNIEKKGVKRKKKYNKLIDGANLLELLDMEQLTNDFEDLKRFLNMFSS